MERTNGTESISVEASSLQGKLYPEFDLQLERKSLFSELRNWGFTNCHGRILQGNFTGDQRDSDGE